jgi:hypothetical protein
MLDTAVLRPLLQFDRALQEVPDCSALCVSLTFVKADPSVGVREVERSAVTMPKHSMTMHLLWYGDISARALISSMRAHGPRLVPSERTVPDWSTSALREIRQADIALLCNAWRLSSTAQCGSIGSVVLR